MDKTLIDYLKQIQDQRSPHGLRHPLWLVLLIIIMGMMSGYWGYRQLGRFVERHRTELIRRLEIPKARVPSYSVIRRGKDFNLCLLSFAIGLFPCTQFHTNPHQKL